MSTFVISQQAHLDCGERCNLRLSAILGFVAWFTRNKPGMDDAPEGEERRVRTEGLWLKCEECGQIIWRKALEDNLEVCTKCEHHFRIDARRRLDMLFDEGSYEEFDAGMVSTDPLSFVDSKTYKNRLAGMQAALLCPAPASSGGGNLNGALSTL